MALSQREVSKLWEAMQGSLQKRRFILDQRKRALRAFVGKHYSEDGSDDKKPLPLLALSVIIHHRKIAARRPKVLMTSPYAGLTPVANNFELAFNHTLDEINYGGTSQIVTLNALFGQGIIKTGITRNGDVNINGVTHDVGQVFADVVSEDDFVYDMEVVSYDKVAFSGDRYQVPKDYITPENGFEGAKAEEVASANEDSSGGERASQISRGREGFGRDGYREYVWLWDVWVPGENLIVTIPDGGGKALRQIEWNGPERGPYHLLNFQHVPDQIQPLPPVALWRDLDDLANRLFNKLGRQAERQKKVLGYSSKAAGDAERVIYAKDGTAIKMDDPNKVAEFDFGGIDQSNMAFLVHLRDLFSWVSGNLDVMGGLSSMANTLGQEELLNENSSDLLEHMRDVSVLFHKDVCESLGLYMWNDPLIDISLNKPIPGTDLTIPTRWTPEMQEGDWLEYNLDIDPYSMSAKGPSARLNTLVQVYERFILPAAPYLAEQGIFVDWEGFLRNVAKYTQMDELDSLLYFAQGPQGGRQEPVQTGGEQPRQSPVTRRENGRINRPAGNRVSRDNALMQSLLGGKTQPSEAGRATDPGVAF